MSLCQNVARRGAVYWWRKKIRDRSASRTRLLAISLKVREPNLAKRLAALLNVKLDNYRAAIMSGSLTIDQTRALLAHFIERERETLDNSIFRAQHAPHGWAANSLSDEGEAVAIRDQRALAVAYEMASQHPKWQNADEETILTWRQGQGLTEEEGYIVVDYLKVWAPTMTKAGAEGFGPSIEYMKTALASVGAEPSQENIDILWRQFLKVRGRALGDYEQRRREDVVGIDDLFEHSTRNRLAQRELAPPALDLHQSISSAAPPLKSAPPSSAATDVGGSVGEALAATSPASVPVLADATVQPEAKAASPAAPKLSAKLLSEVCAEFQRKTYEVRTERSPKGENKSASNHAVLVWILGDKPLDSYTADDISAFEDTYRKLPNDYKNLRKHEQSAKEVVEFAEQKRKILSSIKDARARGVMEARLKPLSAKSFNAKIGALKEVLLFAGLPNITRGWHQNIKKSKTVQRKERLAPEKETVQRLFSGTIWTGRQSAFRLVAPGKVIIRDSLYWIPLLCAHHGIRLDEAAQLRGRHIVRSDGILCFDLSSDPSLVLKNDNARRLIPVHQKILDLGFDHLLENLAADAQLFSELSNDNKNKSFGESVSKRYGRYLQKIFGAEIAKTLTSHCFRHFVATQLGNNPAFKDSWVNELMGHEGARVSEADRYNKQIYVKNLKAMVDSISAPIDYERLRSLATPNQ